MGLLRKALAAPSPRNLFVFYGPLLVIACCALTAIGGFHRGDLFFMDRAFQLRGEAEPSPDVAIVAISEQDFQSGAPRWPWPRSLTARLIDEVASYGPAVIAVDILYTEPSATEALVTRDVFAHIRSFLYQSLSGRQVRVQTREGDTVIGPGTPGFDDIAAGTALARAQDVELADAVGNALSRGVDVVMAAQQIIDGGAIGVTGLYPQLAAVVRDSVGLVGVRTDADGVLRRYVPYGVDMDGRSVYGMALTAAARYVDVPLPPYPSPGGDIPLGERVVVPSERGTFLVNYRGPGGSYPTVSARDVLRGDQDLSTVLSGKIVFIGVTDPAAGDVYATPFSGEALTAGVEFQAAAADTILSDAFIRTLPRYGEFLAIVGLGLLGIVMGRFAGALLGMTVVLTAAGLLLLAWGGLFAAQGYLLPVTSPMVALAATYLFGVANRVGVEQLEKRQTRSLFGRYLSPWVVDEMLKTPGTWALGGKRAELTILFSDIRGFTTLSERLPPEEVVSLLNEYLAAMTKVVFRHEGTIDKFEGDAILAFFGAPRPHDDDADRAVQTALAMRDRLAELQERWQARTHSTLEIGIGINTGTAVVGNVGSAARMEYTIIGDAVNLAARLQEMTKEYHVPIIISGDTYSRLTGAYLCVSLGSRVVRGRQRPVDLYEVVGRGPVAGAVPARPSAHDVKPARAAAGGA